MFILGEFAVCLVIVLVLGVVVVTLAGAGYGVKVALVGATRLAIQLCGVLAEAAPRIRQQRSALDFHWSTLEERCGVKRYIWLRSMLGACAFASVALAQVPAPPADNSSYTINVSVNEVMVHATVRLPKGALAARLERANFQIFEDGAIQRIKHFNNEDIPVTVGLVIDNSGSMAAKRAEVIAAALAFAVSSNPRDQMFLVNFNERVTFGLPRDTPFTDDHEVLKSAMSTVKADGKTALYDAVATGLEHLKNGRFDKRVLIVVSDGGDNASTKTKKELLALAAASNAIIYALGIYEQDDPENRNPGALKDLVKVTGGAAFFPEDIRDVRPLCERIAHEIRNQYTLSYIPTNQRRDGGYRRLQVRAALPTGRGLVVTTRLGYVAPIEVKPVPVTTELRQSK